MKYINYSSHTLPANTVENNLPNEVGDLIAECLGKGDGRSAVRLSGMMDGYHLRGFVFDGETPPKEMISSLYRLQDIRTVPVCYKVVDGKLIGMSVR